MAIDPFLYIAFAGGFVAGRVIAWRSVWVERATVGTIIGLVFVLGASLSGLTGWDSLVTLPLAFAYALGILGLTALVVLLLPRPDRPVASVPLDPPPRVHLGVVLAGVVVVGYLLGRFVTLPTAPLLSAFLYALLALVAFDLRLSRAALRSVGIPLTAACVGAIGGGVLVGLLTPLGLRAALATSLGFGWYTLAGPLVTARLGATAGLFAFLTNFLRENLTMVLAPATGRRLRGEGLAALGGATAMDTTLYFVLRYGDPDSGSLALASGLVLTIVASLVLPLVLGVTGA
ncbi:MAG: lysine exporter LysO family protein [Thermoplasmata archaeon]